MGKGRPRKPHAARRRDGRTKDVPEHVREAETLSVALQARQRVHGVSVRDANKRPAESPVGRLLLSRQISEAQYLAAEGYERVRRAYEHAILISRPGSAGDLNRRGGHDGSDGTDPGYVHQCNSARRAYHNSRRALLDADPFAQFAVDAWVIESREAYGLIPELRIGLNVLAHLYRVEEWNREKVA